MNNSPDIYIDRMIEISKKKYKLLQDVYRLTERQAETITEDGMDNLQEIINQKQVNIDEIDKVDDEFNVYYQRLKIQLKVESLSELKDPSIKGIKELQECIAAIVSIVTDICSMEKNIKKNSKELMQSFAKEINVINRGKTVSHAYGQGANQSPSFYLDKKKWGAAFIAVTSLLGFRNL